MERPRLLLADDSLTIQRVVHLTFADEGIDVVSVGDGNAAIREIANARPDIVLADVHMPGPNGYEICSHLRGAEVTAKVPLILLVGSFEPFEPEQAEHVGADGFVTKPFQSIRQLVEQVKELLQREQNTAADEGSAIAAEPTPASPEFDTSDIDSLYLDSFAETIQNTEPIDMEMTMVYSGDRMDDEILETSYGAVQPADQFDGVPADGELSGDIVEVSPAGALTEVENLDAPSGDPAYDETLQMEMPPIAMKESEAGHSVHSAPTEEFRRDPFATTTDAFDLDDIDLLDLSDTSPNEEISFATRAEAMAQGSNKRVVSISPELMEIIVKKVVEKLSEKY